MAMSRDEWFKFIDQLRDEGSRYTQSSHLRLLLMKAATELEDMLAHSGIVRSRKDNTKEFSPIARLAADYMSRKNPATERLVPRHASSADYPDIARDQI
jgi:hypothetical protein